jgi:hypothetical protein
VSDGACDQVARAAITIVVTLLVVAVVAARQ